MGQGYSIVRKRVRVADLTVGTPSDGGVETVYVEQAPPEVLSVRALSAEDMQALECRTRHLAQMRVSHQEAARLLAQGHTPTEVAALTGYSLSTIRLLRASPAFSDLVSYYVGQKDAVAFDMQAKLALAAADGLQRLHEHLLDESATPSFVRQVTMDLLDRTGHAPVQRVDARVQSLRLTPEDIREIKESANVRSNIEWRGTAAAGESPASELPPNSAGARPAVGADHGAPPDAAEP